MAVRVSIRSVFRYVLVTSSELISCLLYSAAAFCLIAFLRFSMSVVMTDGGLLASIISMRGMSKRFMISIVCFYKSECKLRLTAIFIACRALGLNSGFSAVIFSRVLRLNCLDSESSLKATRHVWEMFYHI